MVLLCPQYSKEMTMTIAQTKAARKKHLNDPRWKHKGKRSVVKSNRRIARQKTKQDQMAARKKTQPKKSDVKKK